MTTAFVLSGGGNLGAVQVGMLLALADRGIVPDLFVGTSVGALNAVFLSAAPSAEGVRALAEIWSTVRRRDVFPTSVGRTVAAVTGRSPHVVDPGPLRRLVTRTLRHERLEEAPWPVAVVATEVTTGKEVVLTSGSAVDAVMASTAIPAVFPPVTIDGVALMDGGLVNNTPISVAASLGADRVFVLPTGYSCALSAPPRSALGMALHAASIAIQQRLVGDVASLQHHLDLHVAPPLCPIAIGPTDFGHTAALIADARASTRRWLDQPTATDQTTYLSLHSHRPHTRDHAVPPQQVGLASST